MPHWLKIYGWLRYDEERTFIYCDVCTKFKRKIPSIKVKNVENHQHSSPQVRWGVPHQMIIRQQCKYLNWRCVEKIPLSKFKKFAEIALWVGSTRHSLPQRNSYKVSIIFQCSRVCRITEWCLRRGTERESGYVSSCYCISSWKYWNKQSHQVGVVHADYR